MEREREPDPSNLDRDYNCVKFVQNLFINSDLDVAENMNILLYKKVQPCPLRSQITKVKKSMFSSIKNMKMGSS